jgi:hypothetical protein
MRVIVLGSCQARALAINLRMMSDVHSFDYIELQETHYSPIEIMELADGYDLILSFMLDEPRWGPLQAHELRATGKAILIPRIYFDGFHTDFGYIETHGGKLPSEIGAFHLRLATAAALSGLPLRRCVSLYRERAYLGPIHEERAARSLEILREKEASCDLIVSDLLSDHAWAEVPLHTPTHPAAALLVQWLLRIADFMNATTGAALATGAAYCRFAQIFEGDLLLPILPGIAEGRSPAMPRSTSARLGMADDYRLLRLEDLIARQYEIVAELDLAGRTAAEAFAEPYAAVTATAA